MSLKLSVRKKLGIKSEGDSDGFTFRFSSADKILGISGTELSRQSRKIASALKNRAGFYKMSKNPFKKYAKIRGMRETRKFKPEPKPYIETWKVIRRRRTL